jgi:hypothetical protein
LLILETQSKFLPEVLVFDCFWVLNIFLFISALLYWSLLQSDSSGLWAGLMKVSHLLQNFSSFLMLFCLYLLCFIFIQSSYQFI